jgi:hypothetical protein
VRYAAGDGLALGWFGSTAFSVLSVGIEADAEGARVCSWFVTQHRSWDDIAEVSRFGHRGLCLVGRDDAADLRFLLMRREPAESIAPALTAMLRDPASRPAVSAAD